MKTTLLTVMCLCVFLLFSSSASAASIAFSSFDSDPDGWTTLSTDLTWQSSGGVSDTGYIRYNNNLGSNARVHAPAKFLGDWVSMEVVEITYQANIFQTGNFVRKAPYRVSISGPGGDATWYGPAVEPSTTWKFLSVPVEEAEWDISSGTWEAILSDVTDFSIVMAYYTNTSPFEITGVDNVSLNVVPLPSAIWLLGPAVVALIGLARPRNT